MVVTKESMRKERRQWKVNKTRKKKTREKEMISKRWDLQGHRRWRGLSHSIGQQHNRSWFYVALQYGRAVSLVPERTSVGDSIGGDFGDWVWDCRVCVVPVRCIISCTGIYGARPAVGIQNKDRGSVSDQSMYSSECSLWPKLKGEMKLYRID